MTVPTTRPRSAGLGQVGGERDEQLRRDRGDAHGQAGGGQPGEARGGGDPEQGDGDGPEHHEDERPPLQPVAQGHEQEQAERRSRPARAWRPAPCGGRWRRSGGPCRPGAAGRSRGWRRPGRSRPPSPRGSGVRSSVRPVVPADSLDGPDAGADARRSAPRLPRIWRANATGPPSGRPPACTARPPPHRPGRRRPAGPVPRASSSMSTAATFSSRWARRFMPGIGMTCSPRDSTQARAIWAGLRPVGLRPKSPLVSRA